MPLRCALLLLAALGVLIVPSVGLADTFDMKVHAYCKQNQPFGPCTFPNESSFRARQIQNIQGMNQRLCDLGITFRPQVVNVTYDFDISFITAANGAVDPDPSTYGGFRVKWLRDNIAAPDPTVEHMFVVEGLANTGFAAQPPFSKSYANEYYGLFIAPMFFGGAWAHEMGHHTGLSHTWTWQDPGIDRDGDNLACTPDDPGIEEDIDPGGDHPDDDRWGGALRVGHEYCLESFNTTPDPNVPSANICTINCFENTGGGTQFLNLMPPPPLSNAMSAYTEACHGPYTVGQTTSLAFCSDQTAVTQNILATIPERLLLQEVCGGAGGDTDCDGICQDVDNCPDVANTDQANSDSDFLGDLCDNCLMVSNPDQADLDDDGVGDLCDTNKDGDCCDEGVDDDDLDPTTRVGSIIGLNCPINQELRGSGCLHSDNDGTPNCQDLDDDNDGVLDINDGCPNDPNDSTGIACTVLKVCPETVWWLSCKFSGTGCFEFGLKLYELINPAATTVIFQRFEIVNQTLYVYPDAGQSLGDLADFFLGASAGGGGAAAASLGVPGGWNLEIWTKDDAGNLRAFRELVTTYQIADVVVGDLTSGAMLAVEPPPSPGGTMSLAGTWSPGLTPGLLVEDGDRDGLPAFLDLCTEVADPEQRDSDRDNVGDRCDPDFDNNGWVNAIDQQHVVECLGVDLLALGPTLFEDPNPPAGYVPPDPAEAIEAVRRSLCGDADLTGDGRVDDSDMQVLQGMLGGPPGPSGFVSIAPFTLVPSLPPWGVGLLIAGLAAAARRAVRSRRSSAT